MKFPCLASLIVFILWLHYRMKRTDREAEKSTRLFWEKEAKANNVRRKPLDDLRYIKIPLDKLPLDTMTEDPEVADCIDQIKALSDLKVVNFTGISNTDLKLAYGAPNMPLLAEYDQNYTLLARTLQKWADLLYRAGHMGEARSVLEFAVSTGTDVSKTYKLLASIYRSEGANEKIDELVEAARKLHSPLTNSIVRALQGSDPSYD